MTGREVRGQPRWRQRRLERARTQWLTAWGGGHGREDVGVLLIPGSGSWAMAVTFRERTLEEEQADSAKDRRGLALPRLSCLPWDGRVC